MTDTDGKVKTYKHPDRNKTESFKAYVPQYQVNGIEPGEYHGAVVPSGTQIARPTADNPRLKRPAIQQPYAPADTTSPIGRGKGPVPNVGNNMEHTWSSDGSDIVDDITGLDPNHPMVDNNEFVTDEALGFRAGPIATEMVPAAQGQVTFEQQIEARPVAQSPGGTEDLVPILADLGDDSFLLIVAGVPVCSGPKEEIQDQARALVFGEHEMCDGNPVPVDDIIILKRVKVKVGLFLE
jgi:hypothetical protein